MRRAFDQKIELRGICVDKGKGRGADSGQRNLTGKPRICIERAVAGTVICAATCWRDSVGPRTVGHGLPQAFAIRIVGEPCGKKRITLVNEVDAPARLSPAAETATTPGLIKTPRSVLKRDTTPVPNGPKFVSGTVPAMRATAGRARGEPISGGEISSHYSTSIGQRLNGDNVACQQCIERNDCAIGKLATRQSSRCQSDLRRFCWSTHGLSAPRQR